MKLLTVPTSTTLHEIPLHVLNNIVSEGVQSLEIVDNLLKVLFTEDEYERQGKDIDLLEDEQLAELDTAAFNLSFRSLQEYQAGMSAPSYLISRRIEGACVYLEQLAATVSKLSALAIPLTDEQVIELRKLARLCMAELSFFLYYGFLMDVTEKSVNSGGELQITLPVKVMFEETGKDKETFFAWLGDIRNTYRPRLAIFEAYPELEEEFLEVAGPYVSDFETYSQFVSLSVLRSVLVENADVEEVVRALETQYKEEQGQ